MPNFKIESMNPSKKKYVIHKYSEVAPKPKSKSKVKFNIESARNIFDNMYDQMIRKK